MNPPTRLDVFDRKERGASSRRLSFPSGPNNIAVSKDGARIFVAIRSDPGAVDVIDASTLYSREKASQCTEACAHNIYVTPEEQISNRGLDLEEALMTVIDLFDLDSIAWEHQFDKGVRPMAIEANQEGSTKRIFVQLSDTDGFAVVDFAKREEVARIMLPDRHTGIELNAGEAAGPSHGIGVSPDGKTLWVTSILQNAIFAYSLPDLNLVGQVLSSGAQALPGRYHPAARSLTG